GDADDAAPHVVQVLVEGPDGLGLYVSGHGRLLLSCVYPAFFARYSRMSMPRRSRMLSIIRVSPEGGRMPLISRACRNTSLAAAARDGAARRGGRRRRRAGGGAAAVCSGGVGLSHGRPLAVCGLSLDIGAGGVTGRRGPCGVGTSRRLALVAGARRIQTGEVH